MEEARFAEESGVSSSSNTYELPEMQTNGEEYKQTTDTMTESTSTSTGSPSISLVNELSLFNNGNVPSKDVNETIASHQETVMPVQQVADESDEKQQSSLLTPEPDVRPSAVSENSLLNILSENISLTVDTQEEAPVPIQQASDENKEMEDLLEPTPLAPTPLPLAGPYREAEGSSSNDDSDTPSPIPENVETQQSSQIRPAPVVDPSQVIELLDDDDDEENSSADTAALIAASQPQNKRQKTSALAQASFQSRAAHMPSWIKQVHGEFSSGGPTSITNPSTANTLQQLYQQPASLPKPQVNAYLEPSYLSMPPGFTPSWKELAPRKQTPNAAPPKWKAYRLSLLNVSEFTITGAQLQLGDRPTSLLGLRGTIKSIAKEHGGKAFFQRDKDGETEGKWHIPLGAYHAFFAYLRSDPMTVVDGIPEAQLKIASLGRARLEKDYPAPEKLISLGVPPRLARALAPFQRGGVDFVLEKEGRALIADEMGLGKTIQAIASMTVYHDEWPLLILCPSTARYHWENEFRHWLGENSAIESTADVFEKEKASEGGETSQDSSATLEQFKEPSRPPMSFLQDSQIHVLGSGNDPILPHDSTRVVVCSYGLAPNLIKNRKIAPGLFKCAIVDESHMLKNKATQRTQALLPVLCATSRCILLSGTPAFARPMELWPQLAILGTERHGWWQDEAQFVSKYVRNVSTERRAELHTLLTGTIMIRRMKNDILKSLPSKIRELATVDVMDKNTRTQMQACMEILRKGKGRLSEYARQHTSVGESEETAEEEQVEEKQQESTPLQDTPPSQDTTQFQVELQQQRAAAEEQLMQEVNTRFEQGKNTISHTITTTQHQLDQPTLNALYQQMLDRLNQEIRVYHQERTNQIQQQYASLLAGGPSPMTSQDTQIKPPAKPDSSSRKAVLNEMYCLTGQAKIQIVVDMLKLWLDDPTKGKLCIFAHHISVLDAIGREAGLSLDPESENKCIRIDGSTSPKARQEYINTFQSDPSVRIALLGITAAGVAVTLTACSTVWFAELFWTPALMIQAEDRCHRIGQQARVHCLYFLAKGTLDELLWKLIERKFQDLGEFVEGKEKLKMVVDKTFQSVKELKSTLVKKAIVEEDEENLEEAELGGLSPLTDIDIEIQHDIEELGFSEQVMVKAFEVEDEEPENDANAAGDTKAPAQDTSASISPQDRAGKSENEAICLSDSEEEEDAPNTSVSAGDAQTAKSGFDFSKSLSQARLYNMLFRGPKYGIQFTLMNKRMVVTGTTDGRTKPSIGDILVSVNNRVVPLIEDTGKILQYLSAALAKPPVQLTLAEDAEFAAHIMRSIAGTRQKISPVPAPSAIISEAVTSRDTSESGQEEVTSTESVGPVRSSQPPVIELIDD